MKSIHIAVMAAIATIVGFIVELPSATNYPSGMSGVILLDAKLSGFFKCLGVGVLYGGAVGITALIIKALVWPKLGDLVTWCLIKINHLAIVVMVFAVIMGVYTLFSGK